MTTLRVAMVFALVPWGPFAAAIVPGDAARGEKLFHSQRCVQCHSIKGEGGRSAPDLGRRIDRNFTPSVMASLMWNHAPRMWAEMKQQGIQPQPLSASGAADLFAFFMSARYFEKPGDASRGKQVFAEKHCAGCHGIARSPVANAPPVANWESLSDPIVLAQQMWNHGAQMREEFSKRNISPQRITAQELTDVLVYLQNLPETRGKVRSLSLSDAGDADGKLFEAKGCAGCHIGKLALEGRLRNQTLTAIAVDMWNHQPKMRNSASVLSAGEMRQIISFIWARQYFAGEGNPVNGEKVYAQKSCGMCHEAGPGPKLGGNGALYSQITMVSALWAHGPGMLELMTQKNLPWPQFTAQQMSDLIAYLNSHR